MIVALAAAFAAPRLLRLLRRTRWLLLALVVLFVWATPGVLLFLDLGSLSPTADGLSLAWAHGARLIVILASLALLLEFTPTDEFVGALYGLMRPLSFIAVDRARIAVRLMLVMQYVESPPAARWRDWLRPSAHPTPPRPHCAEANAAAHVRRLRRAPFGARCLRRSVGVRLALRVEYHGGAFRGWQSQACGNTVQDALQRALSEIAGERVTVVCAGRTDAGVHALAQVVHFDTSSQRPLGAWVRGTNSHLPQAVARALGTGSGAGFSRPVFGRVPQLPLCPVRFASASGAGCRAGLAGSIGRSNLEALRAGAEYLLGEHDFSAFRAAECQARSPVKVLHQAQVARHGELVVFEFRANAFLQHMVRNMVGALVYVGKRQACAGLDR
ncbi:MAG: tRNA pseudouridine synthase A [Comamonadaceae bacterium]|nr:tRNA pseudouridine synthase A [Comamonadaceae bacterium]